MRSTFGYKREYEDLDAEYHQQPRERVPPFTPKPYMASVSSPAMALEEAARARRNVAMSAMMPALREVHRQSQARMLSLANTLPAATEKAVEAFRTAVLEKA
jgi:hypothetical protein